MGRWGHRTQSIQGRSPQKQIVGGGCVNSDVPNDDRPSRDVVREGCP